MRIAMVSTPFLPVPPPANGGTERIVAELFDGLRALGHEVRLYACGDVRDAACHAVGPAPTSIWSM